MAYYESWRTQKDADRWLERLGFKERLILGKRIYFDEDSGETLQLFRSKQIYEKTLQHGVHLTEGILDRLIDYLKGVELTDEQRAQLWDFIKEEKNSLNEIIKKINVPDNW